ncbi:MAG: hypothetical protein IT262_20355 [Saprospiraceae bacterium]|nr:hypothetical protein [Saprospiraceae bacterium]
MSDRKINPGISIWFILHSNESGYKVTMIVRHPTMEVLQKFQTTLQDIFRLGEKHVCWNAVPAYKMAKHYRNSVQVYKNVR